MDCDQASSRIKKDYKISFQSSMFGKYIKDYNSQVTEKLFGSWCIFFHASAYRSMPPLPHHPVLLLHQHVLSSAIVVADLSILNEVVLSSPTILSSEAKLIKM